MFTIQFFFFTTFNCVVIKKESYSGRAAFAFLTGICKYVIKTKQKKKKICTLAAPSGNER